VSALKAASSQMRGAMKHNKELDLNFIDNLQVRSQLIPAACWRQTIYFLSASTQSPVWRQHGPLPNAAAV
jgi:hypothetical protein